MKILILALLFQSLVSHASQIEISMRFPARCVPATARTLHDSITDYASYPKFPGAVYEDKDPPFAVRQVFGDKVRMLYMFKAQPKYYARNPMLTDAHVWIQLQPTNLKDANLYPSIMLKCNSDGSSAEGIKVGCLGETKYKHFALDGFNLALTIGKDGACKTEKGISGTTLEASYKILVNETQVEEIRKGVVGIWDKVPLVNGYLKTLFNPKEFIENYFRNFYTQWVGMFE